MAFDPTTARPLEPAGGLAFDPSTATPFPEPTSGVFDPATATPWIDATKAKKEEAGFTGSFTSALKERVETALPAAKLYFGVGDQAAASKEMLEARERASAEYKQTEFGDIGDAYREGNYGEALDKTYQKFKEVAGSSFGAMAPAMVAGAGAAGATALAGAAIPAALVGTAAYGITALGSYIADNIGRQKEEQKKLGKEAQDIERLPATVAAAGQTALDIFGFKFFKPLGQLVGLEGKAAANAAAMEIVEAATKPGAYRRAVATGTAKGIAFEVPQEVTQQVLERWQAGLDVNPFTDPEAAKEYLEAAGGALMLGGPMGAVSSTLQTRKARQIAGTAEEEQAELDKLQEQIGREIEAAAPPTPTAASLFTFDTPEEAQAKLNILRRNRPKDNFAIQETEDGRFGIYEIPPAEPGVVSEPTEPVARAGEPSAEVPSGAVGAPAAGVTTPDTAGLVPTTTTVGQPAVGEAAQPGALEIGPAILTENGRSEPVTILSFSGVGGRVYADISIKDGMGEVLRTVPLSSLRQGGPNEATVTTPTTAVPSTTPAVSVGAAPTAVSPTTTEAVEAPAVTEATEPLEEIPSAPETTETIQTEPTAEEKESVTAAAGTPSADPVVANEVIDSAETAFNEAEAAAIAEEAVAAEEAKVEAPKRKRAPGGGRKRKAAEDKQTPEERREQSNSSKAYTREVEGRANAVERLALGLAPEDFAKGRTAEEAQTAYEEAENNRKEDLFNNKLFLYIAAQSAEERETKAGDVARAAVAKFTEQERQAFQRIYDDYKASKNSSTLKSTKLKTTAAADTSFNQATTADQALRRILRTGTAFEKLLAQRLMGLVKGVKFVVVEKGAKLPAHIDQAFTTTTQGVYDPSTKTIYVRGASFGEYQGINNTVVLHEALHAATRDKIEYALALMAAGKPLNKNLEFLVDSMRRTMNRVDTIYKRAKADGRTTPYLDKLSELGAFTNLHEFVSYGFTDNVMQRFMANIPGQVKGTTMFSKFVEAVRKMLGLGEQHQSTLQDLVVITDALLGQRLPADANTVITSSETLAATKRKGKESKEKADKIRQPISHPEQSLTVIGQLIKVRNWDDFKDVVSDIYNGTSSQLRRPLLGALTTRQVVDLDAAQKMTDADGKPVLENVLKLAEDMAGAKTTMLDETATLAKKWHEWQKANPGKYRIFNRLIHLATLNQIDPDVNNKSKTLTDMYEALGTDGKALYREVRDFYKARFNKYQQLVQDRINSSKLEDDVKKKLIDQIKQDYEKNKLPEPYFPLMREGQYWLRIGNPKSKNMEYYMFEDPRERNFYLRQRAKELGTTVEAMKADPDIMSMGDNYKSMASDGMQATLLLKNVLDTVDKSKSLDKEQLKDEIYQLYLSTLPEQNFRKHFLHRKGTAGFRSDALRNFAKSSFHTSVQLAKIEYGFKIRRELDRAWEVTKGNPDRDILFRPIYDEITDRVDNVLSPQQTNQLANRLADTLGTASFVYYMSAPASAITNLTGLAVFGVPVLNGEFGPKANLALAKNMNIFKSVGVTDKDGKYTFPTLLSKLTGLRRDAYMEALRRGKIDTTLTYDTLQLSRTPSEQYTGLKSGVMNAIGYLFHHSEKINREVMFMTSYDLAFARAKEAKRDDKTAHEEAINEASRLTDEAMFDYSDFNKARYFRGNLARVILQFKSFAQQTTYYLIKNFKAMFAGASPEVKRTAATKFIGTMGMTAMFAGALGLPLVSVITGLLGMLSEDDEDPEKRNPKLRFRNWLREEFGDNLGLAIERGPVSWATDIDFHSRVKLDQLWFRELKSGLSEAESVKEFMLGLLGPSAGLMVNAATAIERINNGDVARGVEMLLPAGLRGFATAMRFDEEGVRNLKGDKVVSREALSGKEIAIAATGFSPTKVAMKQQDIKEVREQYDKIQEERTRVLDLFKDIPKKNTPETRAAAKKGLLEFNRKNPEAALDADTIFESIERDIEAGVTSIGGIRAAEKYRPLIKKLMPPDPYKKK